MITEVNSANELLKLLEKKNDEFYDEITQYEEGMQEALRLINDKDGYGIDEQIVELNEFFKDKTV